MCGIGALCKYHNEDLITCSLLGVLKNAHEDL